MSGKRYPEEFKLAAVRQITEGGHSTSSVAKRLDVTVDSLYAWVKKYWPDSAVHQTKSAEQTELSKLRNELKRVMEERDLLKKKPRHTSRSRPTEVCLYSGASRLFADQMAVSDA
ncbi:MAG: transposase [Methylophilaceae bacterium]